jgi:DNA-binding LytR/AlgR family response regulator
MPNTHLASRFMLRPVDLRTAVVAWSLFLAGTCAYCLTFQALVWAVTPDVTRTVTVALREWGAWLVVTPLVFGALSRSVDGPNRLRERAVIAALATTTTALVPVTADLLTHTREFAASLAVFLPRNLLAFVVVCLVWRVFVRRETAEVLDAVPPVEAAPAVAAAPSVPDALLVSKGADQCLVSVDRVQRIAAAGNYVEVYAGGQLYLMRATLAQAEARLPAARFVRTHRCHVVRVDEIARILVRRSGSGTVILRDGVSLPLSKRHRAELKQFRISAA